MSHIEEWKVIGERMEKHIIKKMSQYGRKKADMLERTPSHYWLRSILAGMYLTIVGLVYWTLLNSISDHSMGKLLGSLFFGVGLTIIVFTNSELFTSNNMYMAISTFQKETSWKETCWVWIICYLGNFAGAFLIALLLAAGGIFENLPLDHALYKSAVLKAQQPALHIFVKGIFANWIVCLAVWVAFRLQEEISKIVSILLIVFIFLYLGFEHSIANLGTFSMSLLGKGTLTFQEALFNLLYSTPGNIVGGALFLGFAYCYLNKELQTTEVFSEPVVAEEGTVSN